MKVLERSPEQLVFGLASREKTFLERLLSFYPVDPDTRPAISRESQAQFTEAESLLHDSLKEQREEMTRWLRLHLVEGESLQRTTHGWRLTLAAADVERLLQVLNELRVGAWTQLGCPEEIANPDLAKTPGNTPLFAIMTVAGQFQMDLVHALDFGSPGAFPGLPPS